MPANDPLAELSPAGSTVLNAIGTISYTGAQIAALTAVNGQIVYCNTTGSGFTQGHWYGYDGVLLSWVDINGFPDWYDYFFTNIKKGVVDKRYGTKEQWHNVFSGTGAAINNTFTAGTTASIDLVTGTTTTGVAMLAIGGPTFDFSKKAVLKLKVLTPAAATGQIVKLGVGIDKAGTGPATTNCFGVEYCDGDTDWQIHSANGGAQSNFDCALAATAATNWGITIEFNPGTNIVVTFDDGTTSTQKTKSTDIPSSGTCTEDKLIQLSISNNNGSSTSRTFTIKGCYLVYSINDTRWD